MNGDFVAKDRAVIPVEDRAFLFADGIYEVIAAYGGAPVMMEEHLDRWDASAAGLRMPQTVSREQRTAAILEMIRRVGTERVMIYGQLTRGAAPRTHQFPADPEPCEVWFAKELKPLPEKLRQEGAEALTHPDERWARCWIKSTCLLPNVLAKQFAQERGAFDAILYMENEVVTESSAANVYAIKNGVVHTHPANGRILGGITRSMVLRICEELSIPVAEEFFNLKFLRSADEILLSSTTMNVLPISKLDGKPVGTGKPGDVYHRLIGAMEAEIQSLQGEQRLQA